MRERKFATNADLSLAFAGDDEDVKEETRPYSYLLDLPRSLSLSEKWHKLEREVEGLMASYVSKLSRTVWDEWLQDLGDLMESLDECMARSQGQGASESVKAKET